MQEVINEMPGVDEPNKDILAEFECATYNRPVLVYQTKIALGDKNIKISNIYAAQTNDSSATINYIDEEGKINSICLTMSDAKSFASLISSFLPPPPSCITIYLNPVAGRCTADDVFAQVVRPILEQVGTKFRLVRTEAAGHAEKTAQLADQNEELVMTIGGDGLLHEVVNGYLKTQTSARICVVPAGSGNAVATTLGITTPAAAVLRLLHGKTRDIDLLKVQIPRPKETQHATRWALVVVSLAFHARLVSSAAYLPRMIPPSMRFQLAALRHFIFLPRMTCSVTLEQASIYSAEKREFTALEKCSIDGSFAYLAMGKMRELEKGFGIFPEACSGDGWLDGVFLHGTDSSRRRMLQMLQGALTRKHSATESNSSAEHEQQLGGVHLQHGIAQGYKFTKATIKPHENETLCVDGELWDVPANTEVSVELVATRNQVKVFA